MISFLQEGYPFYCLEDNLTRDEDIKETYYIIMNLIFKIFARISTQKESNVSLYYLNKIVLVEFFFHNTDILCEISKN